MERILRNQRIAKRLPRTEIKKSKTVLLICVVVVGFLAFFVFYAAKATRMALLKERINILVLGTDGLKYKGRTDTIVLISYAPKTQKFGILSIPRDTRLKVSYKGKTGYDKVNHIYSKGGLKVLISTLEDTFKIKIPFYVLFDYEGFVNMVDILGGFNVYVEERMHYVDEAGHLYIDIPYGWQRLDGAKALGYMRFRSDGLGDIGRISRQQKAIRILIEKILTPSNALLKSRQLIWELKRHIKTNLSFPDCLCLAAYGKNLDPSGVKILKVEGKETKVKGLSYWEPDLERVRQELSGKD